MRMLVAMVKDTCRGRHLEVGSEVISRHSTGQLDIDGGLHSSAHGHEVGREADFDI